MLQEYIKNISDFFQHKRLQDQIGKASERQTSRQHGTCFLFCGSEKVGGIVSQVGAPHIDSNHILLHQKYHMQFHSTFKGVIKRSPKE